jgi:hypothetical protein
MTVQTGTTAALIYQGKRLGKVTNFSINTQRQALDTSSIGDTDRTFVGGIRQSSGSATLHYDSQDSGTRSLLADMFNSDSTPREMDFLINVGSGIGLRALQALITEIGTQVSVGDTTKCNISFQISGPLENSL